jgi:hypothetical protein
LNEAFDRHVAENMPPHPFGASVDAIVTGYADDGSAPSAQPLSFYPEGYISELTQAVPPGEIVTVDGASLPLQKGGIVGEQSDSVGSGDTQIAQANDNLPPGWDMYPRDPACMEASHECLSEVPPGRRAECLVAEVGCNAQAAKAKVYDPKDYGTGFFPNGRWVIMPGGPTGIPRLYRKTAPSWESGEG